MQIINVEGRNSEPFTFAWGAKANLEDKLIFAFGGAGNLGETFLYAAAHCGARVVLADFPPRDPKARDAFEQKVRRIALNIADLGSRRPPAVLYADVTDMQDVEAAAKHVEDTIGGVDVAVDFAGISHPPFDLCGDDPEQMLAHFKRVVDINLTGAFIVTMVMARHMVPRRKGQVIHLCSSGSRLSLYGVYAYNATKHGVEGIIKTAAAQLARFNVRVNGIAPGTVETDLNRFLLRNPDGSFKPRAMSVLAHTPTKRFLTREGVAETLIAMCLDQKHFTGNVVFADDGYNIEGHSWPEGNLALYGGLAALEEEFQNLDRDYPRSD